MENMLQITQNFFGFLVFSVTKKALYMFWNRLLLHIRLSDLVIEKNFDSLVA